MYFKCKYPEFNLIKDIFLNADICIWNVDFPNWNADIFILIENRDVCISNITRCISVRDISISIADICILIKDIFNSKNYRYLYLLKAVSVFEMQMYALNR